jgi:hypothetical protein
MDLSSAHRICCMGPTVLHDAHNRNVTMHIESAVECTCAADKARKLSCPALHYPTILRREIKTKLLNFKTTKYFVCPCLMYAPYLHYGGIRKVPKENKQNATLCQVEKKCKVVLALSKSLKTYECGPGGTYPCSLHFSSTRMRCQLHTTTGFTYEKRTPPPPIGQAGEGP